MRFHLTWAVVLVFALTALPVRVADWLLTAVPQTTGKDGQVLSLSSPFRVILTNATNHNLTVWKEWCSWGYFNLSFEFASKDGKIVKVAKDPNQTWTKNGPAGFVVLPGCTYTVTVRFLGKKEWTGVEGLHGVMSMKAIYKNTNEAFPGAKPNQQIKYPDVLQKRIDSAWVGQVESEPIQVTIVR